LSGIFGVIDPGGVDPAEVESAAEVMRYRGPVRTAAVDGAVLGVCGTDGVALTSRDGWIGAVDGRLDALHVSARTEHGHGTSPEPILDVISERGPLALNTVAADFALGVVDVGGGSLLIARDAFGVRPLFWARVGSRTAFASDPAFFIRLRLATGDPDAASYRSWIVDHRIPLGRTGFSGIARLAGGRWISFSETSSREGRWFRPEQVEPVAHSLAEVVAQLRERVGAALLSRTAEKRAALLLSGGRDSGSLAVAAGDLGMKLDCYTYRLEASRPREDHLAQQLADCLGFRWRAVDVPEDPSLEDLQRLVSGTGTPFSPPAFPITLAITEAVRGDQPTTLIDGEGGDLFNASPVELGEIFRHARLGLARRCLKGWAAGPGWSATTQLKMVGRSRAPVRLLRSYDRIVRGRTSSPGLTVDRARTARDELIVSLIAAGEEGPDEATERMYAMSGLSPSSPFLDMRVVRLLLEIPTRFRLPVPTFKPLLQAAFLGEVDTTRVKASHHAYYQRLAASLVARLPVVRTGSRELRDLVGTDTYVRRDTMLQSLYVTGPEAWLRWGSRPEPYDAPGL
jgi:asparagine synthase (glutamine-hydrolysing)